MTTFARQYLLLSGAISGKQIEGEVPETQFENQISLTGWNWALKRNTTEEVQSHNKGGVSRANAIPDTFGCTKLMDKSSLPMLNSMKAGEKLTATLTLASATDARFTLVIKLKNVRIIDYKMDAEDGEKSGSIKEDWTFNYDEVTFEHAAEPPKGGGLKNFTSTHKRPAQASTEKSASKAFVDDFGRFSKSDQMSIGKDLKAKNKDAFG